MSEDNPGPNGDGKSTEEHQSQDNKLSVSRRAVLSALGATGTTVAGLGTFSRIGSAAPSGSALPDFNIKEMPGRSGEAFRKIATKTETFQAYKKSLAADGFQPVVGETTAYKIESGDNPKFLVAWPLQEIGGKGRMADDEQSDLGRGQLVIGIDQGTIEYSGAGFLFKSIEEITPDETTIRISSEEYNTGEKTGIESVDTTNIDSFSEEPNIEKSSNSRTITIPTNKAETRDELSNSRTGSDSDGGGRVRIAGVSCVACKAIAAAACAVGCGAGAWVICGTAALAGTPVSGVVCTIAIGGICAAFTYVRKHYTGIGCTNGYFIRVACNYAGYC